MAVRLHSTSTVASSRSRITESRSSARALTKVKRSTLFALPLTLLLSLSIPTAQAHQPIRLTKLAANPILSPVLVDATISFALYADFTAAETKNRKRPATRHVRFVHRADDPLEIQYLIPDTAQMRGMNVSQLPKVTITSPSGKVIRLEIKERTRFSKPYLPQDYFYLSRISSLAEAGAYIATITSRRAASALVAIGYKEVPGEVLEFGNASRQCPQPIEESEPIAQSKADQLIGMKEGTAKLCADFNGWGYRVGMRDGEYFPVTRDYRIDRITVSIAKEVITEVQVG